MCVVDGDVMVGAAAFLNSFAFRSFCYDAELCVAVEEKEFS